MQRNSNIYNKNESAHESCNMAQTETSTDFYAFIRDGQFYSRAQDHRYHLNSGLVFTNHSED